MMKICFKCGAPARLFVSMIGSEKRWYVPTQYAYETLDPEEVRQLEIYLCDGCSQQVNAAINQVLPPPPDEPFLEVLPDGLRIKTHRTS